MSEGNPGSPLYKQPWVYEYMYPGASIETADACVNIIERFTGDGKLKMLEAGCGTGRILERLAALGHDVMGIDSSRPMIEYAAIMHPELRVELADMRNLSLDEQFDVLLCVGSTFTFNLSNADVHATLESFRKHCRNKGLLILGMLNACRFLGSETFNERIEMRLDEGDFHATAFSRHMLDRRRQSFRRVRTWKIDGYDEPVIDDAEFRLFFPLELESYLSQHGFSILGMWDNKDLRESDLSDRRLYLAARAVSSDG